MNPCPGNKKLIAWLALDALDDRSARELRAHLKTCPGCAHYLAEMSGIAGRIASAEPAADLPPSETFHRRLMLRIKAEAPAPLWRRIADSLPPALVNWQVAFPLAAMLAALLVIEIGPRWHPPAEAHSPVTIARRPGPVAGVDLAPTVANYQHAAGQSLEKLDALLAREGRQTSRPAPVCTASAMSLNF